MISIKDCPKSSLKAFDCGIVELNTFLSRYALKNDKLGIGKTFVELDSDKSVLGYFTLSTAQIVFEELNQCYTKLLPRYPIPAIRISRLAVQKERHGKGIGKNLLKQAFLKILNAAEMAGVYLILVDAKETSASFYEHYGFIKLRDLTYFITLDTVRKAIK